MRPFAHRIVLLAVAVLMALTATAQNVPAVRTYNLNFASQHSETFTVYIDGELKNRMPQSRVMVSGVSDQTHEIVVVTKRPIERAAVIRVRPSEPNVSVMVNYDQYNSELFLYVSALNRPEEAVAPPEAPIARTVRPRLMPRESAPRPTNRYTARQTVQLDTIGGEELDAMLVQMRAKAFDSDRLALGKMLVASGVFTSAQIAAMASTLDYSQSQVDFLKYAYAFCLDKANYSQAASMLTYRADRQKVMDYTATQP